MKLQSSPLFTPLFGYSIASRGSESRTRLDHCISNSDRHLLRVIVGPHPQDAPPLRRQSVVGPPVSLAIGLDLLAPPLGVSLWPSPMLGASMPEAAIDEDSNAFLGKNEIRLDTHPLDWRTIYSVTKA